MAQGIQTTSVESAKKSSNVCCCSSQQGANTKPSWLTANGEADHVHLLLSLNPKVAPSVFVNNLKTVSSRLIRKNFGEELAKVYGKKPVFWSRSYSIT